MSVWLLALNHIQTETNFFTHITTNIPIIPLQENMPTAFTTIFGFVIKDPTPYFQTQSTPPINTIVLLSKTSFTSIYYKFLVICAIEELPLEIQKSHVGEEWEEHFHTMMDGLPLRYDIHYKQLQFLLFKRISIHFGQLMKS